MIEKQKSFVTVVVYVYNEVKYAEQFLHTLYVMLNDNFEWFEIICVNDASEDNSKEIIQKIAKKYDNCALSLINMSHYQGVEVAMHAGVDLAIGDFVFEFDNMVMDYNPELIMQTYERALQGYDIVSCGSTKPRIFSNLFYAIYNFSYNGQYKLRSESFRLLSRRAINRVHSMSADLPYRKAIYANCGMKLDFIGYKPINNDMVRGKTYKNPVDTALTALVIFTNITYRISVVIAIIMAVFMFGFGMYTIVVYFSTRRPVEGWAPLMGLISAGFLGMFILLTFIIKYFDILLKSKFNRQRYLIQSVDK
jgi:dolichol-phosphate mannosyltransferase